jgi:anti-sigma regulatory factor (Ser/Thr protein kinase)
MAALAEAMAFIEAFCAAHGVSERDRLRLMLVVEELFTNTVTHGHGGDCEAPVRLWLSASTEALSVRFEDDAPPFDPQAERAGASVGLEAELEDRPVGRLGIPLVLSLASVFSYAWEDGWNRLHLELRREL